MSRLCSCVDASLHLVSPVGPKGRSYDKHNYIDMGALISLEELALLAIIITIPWYIDFKGPGKDIAR